MSENKITKPTAARTEEISIDIVELLYRLSAKWKMIALFAVLGALLAGIYTSAFTTPKYKATATIYVLSNKDSVINMSDLQIGSALTNDYAKLFEIWEVHEAVISTLSLPYSYSQIEGMVSVSNDSNTRMLDITVTGTDPQEVADIANTYAEVVSEFISEKMSADKPSIMSTARVPSGPFTPNKTKNVFMGIILGALAACGLVTVNMVLDDKYKTADDILKYTGLVNLAVIPVDTGFQKKIASKKSGSSKAKKGTKK